MAATSSFDVVSDFDRQELVNSIDQVQRDVSQRYDLKDSDSEISLEEDEIIIITSKFLWFAYICCGFTYKFLCFTKLWKD